MSYAEDLVKGLKNQGSNKNKEYARAAEWPNCSHAGCPLPTTIKADNCSCAYHYKEHGLMADCITEAVKEFVPFLTKHGQMQRWHVRQWKEKRAQLMGWPVLPATEIEMDAPSLYLNRLKQWIDTSIKKKSQEIYNNS